MRLWRICDAAYLRTAFTGEGAAATGGRWNSRGTKVVYASANLSTALLEMLVHVDPTNAPATLRKIPVDVPDRMARETIGVADLPRDWTRYPANPVLARMGDDWVARGKTALLFVPSVVVESDDEPNVLLNPAHADFAKLKIGKPAPVVFDARLARKRRA
jgi:RES domain-containing protein